MMNHGSATLVFTIFYFVPFDDVWNRDTATDAWKHNGKMSM